MTSRATVVMIDEYMMRPIFFKVTGLCVLSTVLIVLTFSKSRERAAMAYAYPSGKLIQKYDLIRVKSEPELNIPWEPTIKVPNATGSRVGKRLPACIIIGVSKCGTRAMLEYLKLHPDIVAPNVEISYYYNETLLQLGLAWYISQMPDAEPTQLVVAKSPDCFQYRDCPSRIYADNNSTKLLVLLRDPVERLVSQYMQLRDKHQSLPTFEEWIIDETTGQVDARVASVMVSAYSVYLVHWLSIFPRKLLHVVKSENLRANPLAEMQSVERFLDLSPFYMDEDFYFNATRGFYCVRNRSTWKTKCLGKSKGRQHIPVREDVLYKLYEFYRPYNEKLSHVLGTTFDWS